jgi:hypothetical protein
MHIKANEAFNTVPNLFQKTPAQSVLHTGAGGQAGQSTRKQFGCIQFICLQPGRDPDRSQFHTT